MARRFVVHDFRTAKFEVRTATKHPGGKKSFDMMLNDVFGDSIISLEYTRMMATFINFFETQVPTTLKRYGVNKMYGLQFHNVLHPLVEGFTNRRASCSCTADPSLAPPRPMRYAVRCWRRFTWCFPRGVEICIFLGALRIPTF